MINISISKKLFNEIYIPYLDNNERYEVFYGGSGSGKSQFVAQKKIYQHLRDKGRNTLVVRKIGKSNRLSTFALIKQTINKWKVRHLFKINESDMRIKCLANGNEMAFGGFAGADDIERLKSITFENGILTDIWIEEASEVSKDDFLQLDLRLRGTSKIPFQITLSFNPISALSWLKPYFFDNPNMNATVLKTTYKDNRFIDEQSKMVIERLKEQDVVYYQIYALGEWGVLGNLILSNYIVEDISTNQDDYEAVYNGMDFGFNNPSALIRIGLKDSELYFFKELYRTGLTNNQLIKEVGKIVTKQDIVIADSAEPARIQEFKSVGYTVLPSVKGKDSVKLGIDFLRSKKLHISRDCISTIREVQGWKYREDRDGNVFEEPVPINDHLMSAARYAIEPLRKAMMSGDLNISLGVSEFSRESPNLL